jgi:hypothetical protein
MQFRLLLTKLLKEALGTYVKIYNCHFDGLDECTKLGTGEKLNQFTVEFSPTYL